MASNSTQISSNQGSFAYGYPLAPAPGYVVRNGISSIPAAATETNPPLHDRINRESRILLMAASCIVIVVGAAVGFWYMISRGGCTEMSPEFQIESAVLLSHEDVSANSSHVSADWTFGLSVTNPNKRTPLFLQEIELSVARDSKSYPIANSSTSAIARFRQEPKKLTAFIVEGKDTGSLRKDDFHHGINNFDVMVLVAVSYDCDVCRALGPETFQFLCKDVMVEFYTNATGGKMVGGPIYCT